LSFFFSIIYTPDIGAPSSLFTINIECKTNNQIYTQRRENTRKRKRQRGSESKGQSICARAKREIRAIASAHTTTWLGRCRRSSSSSLLSFSFLFVLINWISSNNVEMVVLFFLYHPIISNYRLVILFFLLIFFLNSISF
jgi:hypothetical protein